MFWAPLDDSDDSLRIALRVTAIFVMVLGLALAFAAAAVSAYEAARMTSRIRLLLAALLIVFFYHLSAGQSSDSEALARLPRTGVPSSRVSADAASGGRAFRHYFAADAHSHTSPGYTCQHAILAFAFWLTARLQPVSAAFGRAGQG